MTRSIIPIILIALLTLFVIWLITLLAVDYRHDKVAYFRRRIIDMAFAYDLTGDDDVKLKKAEEICNKWSYDQMLYSFKPLNFETWYDEDEIRFLTTHEL